MSQLFETEPLEGKGAQRQRGTRVVAIAVNANVWSQFDYYWPDGFGDPSIAQRVRVPFGRGDKHRLGFVVDCDRPAGDRPLKLVTELIDREVMLDESLWKLAEWISRYYLTPLGAVLAAMIPSAVGRVAPRSETVAFLEGKASQFPTTLGARQRRILDELELNVAKRRKDPIATAGTAVENG